MLSMIVGAIVFLITGSAMVAMTWMMWGILIEIALTILIAVLSHV